MRNKVAGLFRIVAGFVSFGIIIWATNSVLIGFLWGAGMVLGSRYRFFRRRRLLDPSWTGAMWGGFLAAGLATIQQTESHTWMRSFGFIALGTNLAYSGTKAGCFFIGCCQAQWWPVLGKKAQKRSTLQGVEAAVTLLLVLCSILLLYFEFMGWALCLLIGGHGVLRVYAKRARFPLRSLRSFMIDPSAGILIFLCLAIAIWNVI